MHGSPASTSLAYMLSAPAYRLAKGFSSSGTTVKGSLPSTCRRALRPLISRHPSWQPASRAASANRAGRFSLSAANPRGTPNWTGQEPGPGFRRPSFPAGQEPTEEVDTDRPPELLLRCVGDASVVHGGAAGDLQRTVNLPNFARVAAIAAWTSALLLTSQPMASAFGPLTASRAAPSSRSIAAASSNRHRP